MSGYHVGCCVTSHGLGHAARTIAVMEELSRRAAVRFTVVSDVPGWFWESSDIPSLTLHRLQTDVGLVQLSPLHENIPATIGALSRFYPLRRNYLDTLAGLLNGCDLVLCDIAPAGIAAAAEAGVKSVLLENFTWDWIYRGYSPGYPGLEPFIPLLEDLFARADYRIRAQPVCLPGDGDLTVGPISRKSRRDRRETRRLLGLDQSERVVLVSMGGTAAGNMHLTVPSGGKTVFLVPGSGKHCKEKSSQGILCVDRRMHHPDLVAASDVVIGKVGYSTLAEVYHAGAVYGYITRPCFRESAPLSAFIDLEMAGLEIAEKDFSEGDLGRYLPDLFAAETPGRRFENGAGSCAAFLLDLLEQKGEAGA